MAAAANRGKLTPPFAAPRRGSPGLTAGVGKLDLVRVCCGGHLSCGAVPSGAAFVGFGTVSLGGVCNVPR